MRPAGLAAGDKHGYAKPAGMEALAGIRRGSRRALSGCRRALPGRLPGGCPAREQVIDASGHWQDDTAQPLRRRCSAEAGRRENDSSMLRVNATIG